MAPPESPPLLFFEFEDSEAVAAAELLAVADVVAVLVCVAEVEVVVGEEDADVDEVAVVVVVVDVDDVAVGDDVVLEFVAVCVLDTVELAWLELSVVCEDCVWLDAVDDTVDVLEAVLELADVDVDEAYTDAAAVDADCPCSR